MDYNTLPVDNLQSIKATKTSLLMTILDVIQHKAASLSIRKQANYKRLLQARLYTKRGHDKQASMMMGEYLSHKIRIQMETADIQNEVQEAILLQQFILSLGHQIKSQS